jgi:transposase
VASDTLGVSGRLMLEALTQGTHDPQVLADLAKGQLRKKLPPLREALEGRFSAHHGLLLGEMLARIDHMDEAICRLSQEVARRLAPFSPLLALLHTIPGVSTRVAEVILAEIGTDMDHFPTAGHLASWAGLCPGNNESAGKHFSGQTRKGSKWLRMALVEAAKAASRTKGTYLAAQYARLKGRRGHKRATIAVAHSILVIAYYLLEREEPYADLGADYFADRQSSQASKNRLVRQLERLGHKVTLEPAEAA